MPRPDKKGKQSFCTKIQTGGESGGKGKQSFCTKETVPPAPHILNLSKKTGAQDE